MPRSPAGTRRISSPSGGVLSATAIRPSAATEPFEAATAKADSAPAVLPPPMTLIKSARACPADQVGGKLRRLIDPGERVLVRAAARRRREPSRRVTTTRLGHPLLEELEGGRARPRACDPIRHTGPGSAWSVRAVFAGRSASASAGKGLPARPAAGRAVDDDRGTARRDHPPHLRLETILLPLSIQDPDQSRAKAPRRTSDVRHLRRSAGITPVYHQQTKNLLGRTRAAPRRSTLPMPTTAERQGRARSLSPVTHHATTLSRSTPDARVQQSVVSTKSARGR
jgi:hypothetical protein